MARGSPCCCVCTRRPAGVRRARSCSASGVRGAAKRADARRPGVGHVRFARAPAGVRRGCRLRQLGRGSCRVVRHCPAPVFCAALLSSTSAGLVHESAAAGTWCQPECVSCGVLGFCGFTIGWCAEGSGLAGLSVYTVPRVHVTTVDNAGRRPRISALTERSSRRSLSVNRGRNAGSSCLQRCCRPCAMQRVRRG